MTNLIIKNQLYLTIAHNLFLTREQRYLIGQSDNTEINVIGASVPVWCNLSASFIGSSTQTDEPSQEVFCNYYISNRVSKELIQVLDDGYRIYLHSHKMRLRLLDLVDRGAECVIFSHHANITINEREYKVIHFISIHDESRLLTA